jgi:hypothetical protein
MPRLVLLLILALPIPTYGQSLDSTRLPSSEYYQRKSESQHYLAKVFLIGGSAMMFTGMIGFNATSEYGAADFYGYMFVGGSLLALGSVPLFISSSANARKASLAVSIRNEKLVLPTYKAISPGSYPALAIVVMLK